MREQRAQRLHARIRLHFGVPVIAPPYPAGEVLHAQQPNLVIGGFATALLAAAAARNVFADINLYRVNMNSENLLAIDPDVILPADAELARQLNALNKNK